MKAKRDRSRKDLRKVSGVYTKLLKAYNELKPNYERAYKDKKMLEGTVTLHKRELETYKTENENMMSIIKLNEEDIKTLKAYKENEPQENPTSIVNIINHFAKTNLR